MAQILEALKGRDQLINVIKCIVDNYKGVLQFEDNRNEGFISELTIWSECFTKEQLDILFQYTDYPIVQCGGEGKLKLCLLLDI